MTIISCETVSRIIDNYIANPERNGVNAQPHTHELKITNHSTGVLIKYGDHTSRVLRRWWRSEDRIRKLVQHEIDWIVKDHDRESVKAGEREAVIRLADPVNAKIMQTVERPYGGSYLTERQGAWGADLLKENTPNVV